MEKVVNRKKTNQKKKIWLLFLILMVVLFALISLSIGPYDLALKEIFQVLFQFKNGEGSLDERGKLAQLIIWDIRLPRILIAGLVGTALSVSGNVFQGCFRNPLVEPYILGVSSGAAFGASLAIVFPVLFFSIPLSAFIFAALTVLIALSLGHIRGQIQTLSLILAGVVIGSFFSSMVSILKYISNDAALREIIFWLLGGFYHSSWNEIYLIAPIILPVAGLVWFLAWKLNIISIGDEEAKSLGVDPRKNKILLIICATLLTSLSVAYVGIIAWVGLMVPHASRMLIGPDNRYVIPLSAFIGTLFLIFCDTLARNLIEGEIPIGILTSILGAPYLLYLLRTKTL
ncbi:FecCD family ABC transporter permease [Pararhodonellum marinum]|uniref:FecCD family ABC transporter permease n=1 Tax=Pararhodonellum marinum TaxID=2755358 RepID=UPI00188E9D3A|nr:iron ABC transporter permease [Pararhodonellum marinum]